MSTNQANTRPSEPGASARPVGIALLGLGTVGSAVVAMLRDRADHLRRLTGRALALKHAVVRRRSMNRPAELPNGCQTTNNVDLAVGDSSVDIVVEVMGGVEAAFEAISASLRAGKDVVTANKAVLAERGAELFEIAQRHGRTICFEAAVAGGIPIVGAFSQTLAVNAIDEVVGILNGTSNYILSAMHDRGWTYEESLVRARSLGFAEADPSLDVDGTDAAQKLAVLARVAFRANVDAVKIRRQGIDRLAAEDILYARELGYVVKLLAVARPVGSLLHLDVGPTLVHATHPVAKVGGENNAVLVRCREAGDIFMTGRGAGGAPTAASVVAGIVDLACGRGAATFQSLRLWETDPGGPVFDPETAPESRFYLRYSIEDRPGTLARIAGILGQRGVSIASVIQREIGETKVAAAVPLIVMTHRADERAVRRALAETNSLEFVRADTVCLSVAE